tara:strand:- start:284 stop:601 length:318 start_codon:yes stop_codon:yes gene_type:complete
LENGTQLLKVVNAWWFVLDPGCNSTCFAFMFCVKSDAEEILIAMKAHVTGVTLHPCVVVVVARGMVAAAHKVAGLQVKDVRALTTCIAFRMPFIISILTPNVPRP